MTSGADHVPPRTPERVPDKIGAFDATTLLRPTAYDPAMKRPASIAAGAALVMLRALAGVVSLVLIGVRFGSLSSEIVRDVDGVSMDAVHGGLLFVAVLGGAVVLIDGVLAVLIYLGLNWPRVIVMFTTVISITSSFIAWWWQGQEITLANNALLALGLDILILLALSSRSSAAYARRNQRR